MSSYVYDRGKYFDKQAKKKKKREGGGGRVLPEVCPTIARVLPEFSCPLPIPQPVSYAYGVVF